MLVWHWICQSIVFAACSASRPPFLTAPRPPEPLGADADCQDRRAQTAEAGRPGRDVNCRLRPGEESAQRAAGSVRGGWACRRTTARVWYATERILDGNARAMTARIKSKPYRGRQTRATAYLRATSSPFRCDSVILLHRAASSSVRAPNPSAFSLHPALDLRCQQKSILPFAVLPPPASVVK